jgi:hypothetical protein
MRRPMLPFLLFFAACNGEGGIGDEGSGTARFTVYGEDFIEQGIAADEFADGWSARFEKFLVVLGDVTIARQGGKTAPGIAQMQLFDLVAPGPHDVGTTASIPSGHWDVVGYRIAPLSDDTALHASVGADERALVESAVASVVVHGSATKGGVTKRFEWSFSPSIAFTKCVAEQDGRQTPGFSLGDGSVEIIELTIHGDHFFYDDLASPDAELRFDAIARADDDGDADGIVTLAELGGIPLATIADGAYGTGSASHVDDLGAFVAAQVATLGHYRGDGHCVAVTQ